MDFLLDFINEMSPSKLKSYAMIACLAGGIILYLGYQKQKQSNVLSKLVYSPIDSALQGMVKVKGTVEALPTIDSYSPLSKTPAVWYSYTVEEFLGDAEEDSDPYHVVDAGQSQEVFLLKSLRASCLVDPADAEHIKVQQRIWYESKRKPRNIPKLGAQEKNSVNNEYRFTETIILPGETLHIIGEASGIPEYLQNKQKQLAPDATCLVKESHDGKLPLYFSNQDINHLNQDLKKQSLWLITGGILLLVISLAAFLGFLSKGGK